MPSKTKDKKKYTNNAAAQARRNIANAGSQTTSPATSSTSTVVRPRRPAQTPPPSKGVPPVILLTVVGFVVLFVIGLVVIAPWGNSNAAKGGADTPLGEERFANECSKNPCEHVATGSKVSYRLDPPLSGPHYDASQLLSWGFYTTPVQNERVVHNMEHGGVIIYYNCPQGCDQDLENLKVLAGRYPPSAFSGVIVAPHTNLPNNAKFLVTSWQTRLALTTYDADKIQRFMEKYFAHGPENTN